MDEIVEDLVGVDSSEKEAVRQAAEWLGEDGGGGWRLRADGGMEREVGRLEMKEAEDEFTGDDVFVITGEQLRLIIQGQFAMWRRASTPMHWAEWRNSQYGMDFLGQMIVAVLSWDYPDEFNEVWREISG